MEALFQDNFKFIKEDFSKRFIRLDDALRAITPENATNLPDDQLVILITARKKLKSVPIVDAAEVVHGRWEDVFKGNCAWARYKCSVCGGYALYRHEQDIIGKWETVQALTAYCPYCGSYMEEGEMNGNL